MARRVGSPALQAEFDREAPAYDRTARASMPGYSALHRTLIWGVPFLPTRAFRVLELGVGTGALTSALLRTFPHASVVAIDVSPKMIAAAEKRLHEFRDRVELVAGRLEDAWEGRYDAVVSALAIHHLEDREKWRLFRRVHRSLAPGGYFGDGDDHLPEDPLFDSRFAQIASTELGLRPPRGAYRSPQLVWHEHERFDHPCTLAAEVAALERSRFPHVAVPWRYFGQAVVWAYR
ncbi:MAG TPA: methyltransferase domain-containing protein [Thermoplasmata archaeon]|nr:methyltransferase domain-containing protein [Thermoplasmata archaeon]